MDPGGGGGGNYARIKETIKYLPELGTSAINGGNA
jgi:hypothetical protein